MDLPLSAPNAQVSPKNGHCHKKNLLYWVSGLENLIL
jgi:hypothetical protein